MGITNRQEIPDAPIEKQKWSFKKIFPVLSLFNLIIKDRDILEILLGLMIVVSGIKELIIGKGMSIAWYAIIAILIIGIVINRLKVDSRVKIIN
jgi:hypothetical protein